VSDRRATCLPRAVVRTRTTLLLAILALLSTSCAHGADDGEERRVVRLDVPQPWVSAARCGFVDEDGKPVVLRGFNLIAPEASSVWRMAVRSGSNFVRIPVAWSEVEPEAPRDGAHRWNGRLLDGLDRQIRYFRRHGVSVLVDFHQFRWSPYFAPEGEGIPAWFYEQRDHTGSSSGKSMALADWWTDEDGVEAYSAFVEMMVTRYSAFPNVMGYEVFNEPATGRLGENHSATQAVLEWKAKIRDLIHQLDPSRVVFVQTRGGGDLGLKQADFGVFGSLDNVAVDLHSYFKGETGTGYSANGETWVPDWAGAHLRNSLVYTGTEANQEALLRVALEKTRALGIPLLVGEWGVLNDDPRGHVYQRQMLRIFARTGLSWARWDLGTNPSFGLLADGARARRLLAQLVRALAAEPSAEARC
jgi:hypothetical protein